MPLKKIRWRGLTTAGLDWDGVPRLLRIMLMRDVCLMPFFCCEFLQRYYVGFLWFLLVCEFLHFILNFCFCCKLFILLWVFNFALLGVRYVTLGVPLWNFILLWIFSFAVAVEGFLFAFSVIFYFAVGFCFCC